jgi:hypothetical protein
MKKQFVSPEKKFAKGNFKTARIPKAPSPKKKNYEKLAKTKPDNETRCSYIDPTTKRRCCYKLGVYPRFCELHTMLIENVYIAKSNIKQAGNGLFAGPYGFKKGDVIGVYSNSQNQVNLGTLEKRCKTDHCWSYVFCDEGDSSKTKCWDGLDIKSTVIRNINDAHNSSFRNNAYFDVKNGRVYAIASRTIKPHREIFIDYGENYW